MQDEPSPPSVNISRGKQSAPSRNTIRVERSLLSGDIMWDEPSLLSGSTMRVRPPVLYRSANTTVKDAIPVKRSSLEFLPPEMSELRAVLLGNSWSQRSSVGNFILEKFVFNTEKEADQCLRISGEVKEKKVVLINTPDLLHPNITQHELTKHVKNCVRLSAPGPHVFLLVLNPEDFTEEQIQKLSRFLQLFSDRSFAHSLVLISTSREESSDFKDHPPLKNLIRKCRNRSLKQKNLERSELLTRLGQTVKENNGDPVSCDEFDHHYLLRPHRSISMTMFDDCMSEAVRMPRLYWRHHDIYIRRMRMLGLMDDTLENEK